MKSSPYSKLKKKNSVLEFKMTNFKNIIAQMINKYPLVKTVLEGTVKLTSTNDVISKQINGNTNLTAIIEILKKKRPQTDYSELHGQSD